MKKIILTGFILTMICAQSFCQKKSMDFKNKKIRDVLTVFAKELGISIIADSEVDGECSFHFESMETDQALELFLESQRLEKHPSKQTGGFIIRRAEKKLINGKEDKKKTPAIFDEVTSNESNMYSICTQKTTLDSILKKLFSTAKKEYQLFADPKIEISSMNFSSKDFETMLTLILEKASCGFVEREGIYCIFSSTRKTMEMRHKKSKILALNKINCQELNQFIPQELMQLIHISKTSNSILVIGTEEEIQAISETIDMIEKSLQNQSFTVINPIHIECKEAVSLLTQAKIPVLAFAIGGTKSIVIYGRKEMTETAAQFIEKIDSENSGIHAINLKYIKNVDLLKNPPPSAEKDSLIDSGYPGTVFFKGSEQLKKQIMKEIDLIDRPKPQLKYQILIIQYTKNNSKSFNPTMGITKSTEGISKKFQGSFDQIMQLNFDIVTRLGYEFAQSLCAQIAENKARVFTDTTLTAISGEEIKFQNTDTYRYQEYEYDKTNLSTTSTSTQQITSGLIVSLTGWVSSDNMITMSINATISKQNGESSTKTGNLPTTSERVIQTQVRGKNGESIIISGLIKEEESSSKNRFPILSKIPLIGKLFEQKSGSKDKTEIAIYIVPQIEKTPEKKIENLTSECLTKLLKEEKQGSEK